MQVLTRLVIQGVPKVIVQRFGLIARPLAIRSAKFLRECSRKVAHSRNTLRFAAFIFRPDVHFLRDPTTGHYTMSDENMYSCDISKTRHARALIFFQESRISIGQTKVAQRRCDPAMARGRKT